MSDVSNLLSAKPRDKWHHGDLRNSLILWGIELLHENGLDKLSLRQIAKSAGVSVSAPSHHFGDKDGLLAAMAAEGFRQLIILRRQYLEELSPDDLEGRLHAMVRGYMEFARNNGPLFELMFGPSLGGREKYPELVEQGTASYLLFCQVVEPLLPPPDSCSMPFKDIMQLLWSSIHGMAILRVHRRFAPVRASKRWTLDHQTNSMAQFCLAAIAGLSTS